MKKALLSIIVLLAAAVIFVQNAVDVVLAAKPIKDCVGKVIICHHDSSGKYERLDLSCNAAYTTCTPDGLGNPSGHFCEDGTATSGHEEDIMLENENDSCPGDSSEDPTPTPEPSDDPTPSPEPTVSPEPTPTPVGGELVTTSTSSRHSSLKASEVSCENSFTAEIELKDNNVASKNIKVKFEYDSQIKEATTNDDGKASVSFGFSKNESVYAYPEEEYQSQSIHVQKTENQSCSNGAVLGTSTEQKGQVLGAYAGTGIVNNVIADLLGLAGVLMTAGGISIHASKRSK